MIILTRYIIFPTVIQAEETSSGYLLVPDMKNGEFQYTTKNVIVIVVTIFIFAMEIGYLYNNNPDIIISLTNSEAYLKAMEKLAKYTVDDHSDDE